MDKILRDSSSCIDLIENVTLSRKRDKTKSDLNEIAFQFYNR
ncbi:hypothetical protein SAMN05192588_2617 [Nonlabens sp. Hel1_33_55]|nr:hypothetical protein SAMN05192588_2617 [Nonlabens sp. Hel1_33_55]